MSKVDRGPLDLGNLNEVIVNQKNNMSREEIQHELLKDLKICNWLHKIVLLLIK